MKCEFCRSLIESPSISNQRFCSPKCQQRHYNRRPEIREKNKLRVREYRRTHPEWKERHRILAITRHREQRAKYWKEYGKRPEVRNKISNIAKLRRRIDPDYAIRGRLRKLLRHAMRKYSKTGKIMSSKKYGVDWSKIIEHLKPFPKDIWNYEIDHIKPLHLFDLNDLTQVGAAFSPENLQWLTMRENRMKSGKYFPDS